MRGTVHLAGKSVVVDTFAGLLDSLATLCACMHALCMPGQLLSPFSSYSHRHGHICDTRPLNVSDRLTCACSITVTSTNYLPDVEHRRGIQVSVYLLTCALTWTHKLMPALKPVPIVWVWVYRGYGYGSPLPIPACYPGSCLSVAGGCGAPSPMLHLHTYHCTF